MRLSVFCLAFYHRYINDILNNRTKFVCVLLLFKLKEKVKFFLDFRLVLRRSLVCIIVDPVTLSTFFVKWFYLKKKIPEDPGRIPLLFFSGRTVRETLWATVFF